MAELSAARRVETNEAGWRPSFEIGLRVSLLPLEDLTRLMCGNTVYSLIKDTVIGVDLTKCCAGLQKKHALLNLRAIANDDSIRRGSLRLLRHEGCSDEFLTPSAISSFIKQLVCFVIESSSWRFNVDEFSKRLSQRLVLARPDMPLTDPFFYSYKIYQLDHLSEQDYADIQEQARLTAKEVKNCSWSLF
ncbi:hypothetical protein COOONC_24448 [Cooperia oncophora]